MRWRTGLAAAIALAGAALPAAAQDDAAGKDLRCMIITMSLMSSNDPTQQQQGLMGTLYYVGRLDGRTPDLDLEARLRGEVAQLTPQVMAAEAQRCSAQLIARGKALQDIGAHLKDLAKGPEPRS